MAKRAREEADAAQHEMALNQEDHEAEYEYYDEEDDDGHLADMAPQTVFNRDVDPREQSLKVGRRSGGQQLHSREQLDSPRTVNIKNKRKSDLAHHPSTDDAKFSKVEVKSEEHKNFENSVKHANQQQQAAMHTDRQLN